MSQPLARFTPSRLYLSLMVFAYCGAVFSGWMALRSAPCWIAAVLFAITAAVLSVLAFRPAVEIHETHLAIGKLEIPWDEIERVDQTGWNAPLAVHLTLRGDHRIMLLYPGDAESSSRLLLRLRRSSRHAFIDGIPFSEFWGAPDLEAAASSAPDKTPDTGMDAEREAAPEPPKRSEDSRTGAPARYPLLRAEDEEEVERLFQRLKSVGHLESKNSEEK